MRKQKVVLREISSCPYCYDGNKNGRLRARRFPKNHPCSEHDRLCGDPVGYTRKYFVECKGCGIRSMAVSGNAPCAESAIDEWNGMVADINRGVMVK